MKKIILRTVLILLSALIIISAIFTACVFSKAAAVVNPQRKSLISTPEEKGLNFDSFEIQIPEGKIKGWYIPAQNENSEERSGKTVIASHNYSDNREMNDLDFLSFIGFLSENGYNVVTFDYSGSGLSDGKNYTFGQKEETDELISVINYIKNEYPDDKITLYGVAFGAAAALYAAERTDAAAVISDSAYTDLSSVFDVSMSNFTGSGNGFFNACVKFAVPIISSVSYDGKSPLEAVKNTSGKSYLFIHGDSDTVISPECAKILNSEAAAAGNRSEIYTIRNCGHIMGLADNKYNYQNKVLAFLESVYTEN